MVNRIYRQVGTPDTQVLTIEETPGGNATFRISGLSDTIVGEYTTTGDDAKYIGHQLIARFDRFQDYKNYETFVICSWLDNDRNLKAESATIARQAGAGEESPDIAAADALRAWVEESHLTQDPEDDAEERLSGPASSLLNAALGEVNWLEVARTRLNMQDTD